MQNGGFISTADHHGVGWEDETDISGENKRKYYVPIMKQITDEIMPAMEAMKITFEEFVALKALACFQGGEICSKTLKYCRARSSKHFISWKLFDSSTPCKVTILQRCGG